MLINRVKTCKWIGDCFIYTNATNRLSYLIGDQSHVINHFDQGIYLLGYLPAHNRIYVADKDMNILSYALALSVVEYQTAIMRGDMEAAEGMLPDIPADQRNRIARFLEAQGGSFTSSKEFVLMIDLKELALSVSTDPDHRFDLAISLNDLETALDLVRSAPEAGSQAKWKLVGDKALSAWQMDLAQESFEKANDLPALLLLYTSLSDRTGLNKLASLANEKGATNIAFAAYLQLGDSRACIDILAKTGRLPEAALFARSHNTKAVPGVVKQWKQELEGAGKGKVAETIADPEEDSDLFPEGNGGEGSGIMVENEGESQQGYDLAKEEEPSTTTDVEMKDDSKTEAVSETQPEEEEGEHKKTSEKVKETVEHAKDKVEGLVEKVKDLAVGDGASLSTLF
jgi:coatomer subunit beta'